MAEGSNTQSAEPCLDDWLANLENPDDLTTTWAFPNETLKAKYLDSLACRTDDEVRDLLRHFLMPSGSLGSDSWRILSLEHLRNEAPERFEVARRREFVRRLLARDDAGEPTWQGLTWILDLLPHWPMQAINVLDAYFIAHAQELPDGRIHGIGDAQAVIRTMWIGNPVSGAEKHEVVFQLGHRRFEHLMESLYSAMKFQTTLTAPRRDGGRDVIATKDAPGEKQRTLIECKLWRKRVGVPIVRALLGVVSDERSTKGVITAPSDFTGPARTMATKNSRIELLGWDDLLPLLDGYLGPEWGRNVDRHVAESIRRTREADEGSRENAV